MFLADIVGFCQISIDILELQYIIIGFLADIHRYSRYPLVMTDIAIEHGHRNSELPHL